MGRWRWSIRTTIEECRYLGITEMARAGIFRKGPGSFWTSRWANADGQDEASLGYRVTSTPGGGLALRLTYTITDSTTGGKAPLEYAVEIIATPCHFGGVRYWFRCPLVRNGVPCGGRVGRLYLPPGGRYFGCRTCYNLTYRSAKEHDKRVDALVKNPELLLSHLKGGNIKGSLLTLKALLKIEEKL